jgi:hypothetical protein
VVHVSGRNCAHHTQLVKGVAGESQLLQVGDLDPDGRGGRDVTDLQVEDVFALSIELTVSCPFALPDGLLILLLGLTFLFDHSLDAGGAELCHEAVDTSFGVDGEAVLNLQKLFCGVEIALGEGHVGDGVDYVQVIVR